jgi:hypothetical protein
MYERSPSPPQANSKHRCCNMSIQESAVAARCSLKTGRSRAAADPAVIVSAAARTGREAVRECLRALGITCMQVAAVAARLLRSLQHAATSTKTSLELDDYLMLKSWGKAK